MSNRFIRVGKVLRKPLNYFRSQDFIQEQEGGFTLHRVETKKELKEFVKFNIELYKGSSYAVPLLIEDDMNTLLPSKNPAHEFCDAVYYVVKQNERIVGRIAGIINHSSNDKWGQKRVRFGFVDFIDNVAVVDMLFAAVEEWGKRNGCTEIHGPLGFTDFDREGMLIEGFNQLGTLTAIYNYPYYPMHMERMGFVKDVDWHEYKIFIPKNIPERHRRMSDIIRKKYGVRIVKFDNTKELEANYGTAIFELVNEAYSPLYGTSELTPKQISFYTKQYIPLLKPELVSLVVREQDGVLLGFGVILPSLAKALQKAQGKLLPFGAIHLLKTLKAKHHDVLDLMLIGIKPEYQGKGFNALIFEDLIPIVQAFNVKYVESNPELENNKSIHQQWGDFKKIHHKSRRCYVRSIKA